MLRSTLFPAGVVVIQRLRHFGRRTLAARRSCEAGETPMHLSISLAAVACATAYAVAMILYARYTL